MQWTSKERGFLVVCFVSLLVVLAFAATARVSAFAPSTAPPQSTEKTFTPHLRFIREFSSAQDVNRELHPILNRAIDIIAGPKGEEPLAPIALQRPYSVTTDSSHRVFVTDVGTGKVHVFDFIHSRYSLLHGGDPLRSPLGVATDQDGTVYVSDSRLRTVLVYDSKGKFRHYLKRPRGRESYFDTPRGIAVDESTGHIYVCDVSRHMVIMLDKKGHVLARFGRRGGGKGAGEFRYPTQVVAAGDEIVVYDSGNFRIQILDIRGRFRQEIRLADATDSAGVAVDKDKNIYVSDPQLERLQVFGPDGQSLYEFGQIGREAGQFNGISGIWVDSGHCLYVVDTQNKRVQLFQINGPETTECP